MSVNWIPIILIAKSGLPSVLATGGFLASVELRRRYLELMAEHVDRTARQAHERIAHELDSLSVAGR